MRHAKHYGLATKRLAIVHLSPNSEVWSSPLRVRRGFAGQRPQLETEFVVTDPPPPSSEPEEKERERRRLERLLPEIIKRVVEAGYRNISEGPENVREFVREMKLPKEALALILAQIDETKNGLYRVVAKEIRDFLEHSNLSEELTKVLTTLSFEIKTEVRFIPNDARPKPEVRSKVKVRRDPPPEKERPEDDPPDPAPAPTTEEEEEEEP